MSDMIPRLALLLLPFLLDPDLVLSVWGPVICDLMRAEQVPVEQNNSRRDTVRAEQTVHMATRENGEERR